MLVLPNNVAVLRKFYNIKEEKYPLSEGTQQVYIDKKRMMNVIDYAWII